MALTKAHNRMIAGASVDVRDFGAVADGTTDDSAAIQAAIDYARANQRLWRGCRWDYR
jgi:polygalacturonase